MLSLLSCYHKTEEERTKDIIRREMPFWGNRTVLDLAGSETLRQFISHPACQKVLTETWYGEVSFVSFW